MIDRVGRKISICYECGAQRICKMGALWILRAPHMLTANQSTNNFNLTVRTSRQIVNNQKNEQYCLSCTRTQLFFLRATMFRISTKERFNDKDPSVKRWRSIVRNKLNPQIFSVSLEIAPDACKKSQNPLPPQKKANGTTRPPGVNDDESRFPGKSIAWQTSFVISIAKWSFEEDFYSPINFSMGKGFP